MPNADSLGSDVTGISNGMGWLGIAGFVLCALDKAEAFSTCGTAAWAADRVVNAGDDMLGAGDVDADGDGRGLFRLVALVKVGCIVETGGRTSMLPGPTGVGGSVDEYSAPLPGAAFASVDVWGANTGNGLGGKSLRFFADSVATAPGVPGSGCLRGRPRPRDIGGPGVRPLKALVLFVDVEGVEGLDKEGKEPLDRIADPDADVGVGGSPYDEPAVYCVDK